MEHWHEMISGFAENVQPFFMIPSAQADRLNKTMLLTICSMKKLAPINLIFLMLVKYKSEMTLYRQAMRKLIV